MYKLVFVVCHPDDEAIWVGGLLHSLSKISFLEISVVCLSGHDEDSPREKEFFAAKEIAGYHKGVVLGGSLRAANDSLPVISQTLEEGLHKLDLKKEDISLLITHSPYGDEHLNPHHVQAHDELLEWSDKNNVPFGFFSCVPLPYLIHQPFLKNFKRFKELHLLNFSRCRPYSFLLKTLVNKLINIYKHQPMYYFLFNTDLDIKKKMIKSYASIDLEEHKKGYGMFTNSAESLYIFDDKGLKPFQEVMNFMDIPGPKDLFQGISLRGSIKSKLFFWKKT